MSTLSQVVSTERQTNCVVTVTVFIDTKISVWVSSIYVKINTNLLSIDYNSLILKHDKKLY